MPKLTKVQEATLNLLLSKKDARIRGSYQQGKWTLVYTENGFTPTQKVSRVTLDRLFEGGHITLGQGMSHGDSGLTVFLPTIK